MSRVNCSVVTQGGRRADGYACGRRGTTQVLVTYENKAGQPRLRWIPVARVTLHDGVTIESLPRYVLRTQCEGITYAVVAGDDKDGYWDHAQRKIVTPSAASLPTNAQDIYHFQWQARSQSVQQIQRHATCACGRYHRPLWSRVQVGAIDLKLVTGTHPIRVLVEVQS